MAHFPPALCPVCGDELRVTRLVCGSCHTAIEGDFSFNEFSKLSETQQDFALSFIKTSGNIKSMEKLYGISYPTVRARLDEIIGALGAAAYETSFKQPNREERTEILRRLAKGEIDAVIAKKLLENNKE